MSYLQKLENLTEKQKSEPKPSSKEILQMSLSKFASRDLAVEIYSEVLRCKIWFCSNTDMAKQIKGDDPTAVCYTAGELQKLIELNPSKDFLKKIHDTKSVFKNSKIIQTNNIRF